MPRAASGARLPGGSTSRSGMWVVSDALYQEAVPVQLHVRLAIFAAHRCQRSSRSGSSSAPHPAPTATESCLTHTHRCWRSRRRWSGEWMSCGGSRRRWPRRGASQGWAPMQCPPRPLVRAGVWYADWNVLVWQGSKASQGWAPMPCPPRPLMRACKGRTALHCEALPNCRAGYR